LAFCSPLFLIAGGNFHEADKPLILHVALEGTNALVGGLGHIVQNLITLPNKNLNVYSVIPYYEFLRLRYEQEGVKLKEFTIKHRVFFNDGDRISKIYYHDKANQFLVEPQDINNDFTKKILKPSDIYNPTYMFNKVLYFNSAAAELAHYLNVSSVHLHGWHTGLVASLVKKKYNPVREQKQLKPIKVIAQMHMLSEEQGEEADQFLFKHLGLPYKEGEGLNLAASQIIDSDTLIFVSEGLVHNYKNGQDYNLKNILDTKGMFLQPITNSINHDNFSISSDRYNELKFQISETTDSTDVKKHHENIKKILYEMNLIASQDLPLLFYLGRLSEEKGLRYLGKIIEEWIALGGQVVIAGEPSSEQAKKDTEDLKFFYQNTDNVKIYTSIKEDQLQNTKYGVTKGHLLRAASDWAIIPSKVEACGLVAMELLSVGTPIITSWVQGLKDICNPINAYHPLSNKKFNIEDGNAISYFLDMNNPEATNHEIKVALKKAFDVYKNSKDDYWRMRLRLIGESKKFDWLSKEKGAYFKYYDVYNREDQTRNISNNTIKLDDIYNLYNSSDKIGAYENTQLYAVYNNIILSTPCKNENLSNLHDNDCDYEQNNKASVLNGFLYKKDSLHEDGISTWIMDKNGQIYIGAKSHAYYLKGAKGDESYGYPRPIACGGDIVVQDHKIIRINNRSGHYKPTTDQFILALKKMIEDKNGFLHKDVKIDVESELGRTLTYEELMNTPAKSIINNYNFQN